MQISDMLGQYNRNVTNGTEELRGAQSAQKLVSTVGELSAGSVFEGTVGHVKGGKVLLALGNGQTITARLDGKVDIKQGTSMFFQVKSNDGTTVSIRPYTGAGNTGNPTLLNALTAAQIPVTERTLTMVDAMMQEQMSIDRQSLLGMVKLLNGNPGVNVQTIVQMTKLGLPVTESMATQFEQYLSDQHGLLKEMELAVGQIAEALGDENLAAEDAFGLYNKVMDILLNGGAEYPGQTEGMGQNPGQMNVTEYPGQAEGTGQNPGQMNVTEYPGRMNGAPGNTESANGAAGNPVLVNGMPENLELVNGAKGETLQSPVERQVNEQSPSPASAGSSALIHGAGQESGGAALGTLFSEEQLAALAKALQHVPTLAGNTDLFVGGAAEEIFVDTMQDEEVGMPNMSMAENGQMPPQEAVLNKDMTAGEFLRTLQLALSENGQYGFAGMQKLFAGKEFQTLLKEVVEQQWLIKPQDLKDGKGISTLYGKLERQMEQLESALKMTGTTQSSFLQTAADIRGNIEFMNQMNQIYNYIQLPLKMSGQNANGELYVYTNRKNLRDPEAELTAFLHLDMERLGSTDVSVRMKERQVKTNFYFEDDASYHLVEQHLPILEKRLKNKGYNCTIAITNEKKNINFKENFVKRGKVSATAGSLHRYSFDVRA